MCVKCGLVSCHNLHITQMFGCIGLVHIITKLPVVLQANQYIHFTEFGLLPVWTKIHLITDQSNAWFYKGVLVWTFNLLINFNMSWFFISIKEKYYNAVGELPSTQEVNITDAIFITFFDLYCTTFEINQFHIFISTRIFIKNTQSYFTNMQLKFIIWSRPSPMFLYLHHLHLCANPVQ